MADTHKNDAAEDAANRNMSGANMARYKWMTSVLVPSRNRGMYLKPLEYVTQDAKIPFIRIIVSILALAVVVLSAVWYLSNNAARFSYVVAPTIVLAGGALTAIVVFMLSSRNRSMLTTLVWYNAFKMRERGREKTNLKLATFGIKSVDANGTIRFENGDVGHMYVVRGQLSNSTLPSVADSIAALRSGYYVAREDSTQEIRIMSVEPNKLIRQRDHLEDLVKENLNRGGEGNRWRASMAELQCKYMDALVEDGHQLTINQLVILRAPDDDRTLLKYEHAFEAAASAGMYERYHRVLDAEGVISRLSDVVLGSSQNIG